MSGKEIISYLINPDLLNAKTSGELKELLEEYPSFEVARILYIKNLHKEKDIRYQAELQKAALLIGNRALLHALIYSTQSPFTPSQTSLATNHSKSDRTLELINSYMAGLSEEEQKMHPDCLFPPSSSECDLLGSLPNSPDQENTQPMRGQELIEEFIKSDQYKAVLNEGIWKNDANVEENLPTIFEDSLANNGAYFTETLAGIYIKQGRYDKGLKIIRKLYLNYPEKSAYFAEQIKYLEELIESKRQKEQ